jgi:hypothetical protein
MHTGGGSGSTKLTGGGGKGTRWGSGKEGCDRTKTVTDFTPFTASLLPWLAPQVQGLPEAQHAQPLQPAHPPVGSSFVVQMLQPLVQLEQQVLFSFAQQLLLWHALVQHGASCPQQGHRVLSSHSMPQVKSFRSLQLIDGLAVGSSAQATPAASSSRDAASGFQQDWVMGLASTSSDAVRTRGRTIPEGWESVSAVLVPPLRRGKELGIRS